MTIPEPTTFCLDCDYPLDGLQSRRCPECGRAFDPAAPKSYRQHLVPVYEADEYATALAAEQLLAEHQIAAITRAAISGGNNHFGTRQYPGTVSAPAADAGRAREVLAAFDPLQVRSRHPLDRGDESDPSPQPPDPPWTCPKCGEEVDDVFDLCWNCQAARP